MDEPMSVPYIALSLLVLCLGVLSVLIIRALSEPDQHIYPDGSHLYADDSEMPDDIPEYQPPPILITRWGIHRAHLKKGKETEKGCPVCYTLGMHLPKAEVQTVGGWPWCGACRSWHHPSNPTCKKVEEKGEKTNG